MADETFVRSSRKRDDSAGKKYLIRQVGGSGNPVYIDFGDLCTIGRSAAGWTPHLSFADDIVSRVHALVYLDKEFRKCYVLDVGLKGVFPATYNDPIASIVTKNLVMPGGKSIQLSAIVDSLNGGILGDNIDDKKQIQYIINAIKMQYKIGPDGFPLKEQVPRENVARADVENYYPRPPATGVIPKREARFRLSKPDSDLEIIVEPVV